MVTDPSSSPFQIERSVEFFCLPAVAASQDTELLTYIWEFQRNSEFINSFFFSGQNLTHVQHYLSFRFIWFFCKVYSDRSNTHLVALGSKLAEYHGKLPPCTSAFELVCTNETHYYWFAIHANNGNDAR